MIKPDTTTGDWIIDPVDPTEITSGRTVIARVYGDYAGEDIANAKLIVEAVAEWRKNHE